MKTVSIVAAVLWLVLGIWGLKNGRRLFGPDPDNPSETGGARSFGVAHIIAVWLGIFAYMVYMAIQL